MKFLFMKHPLTILALVSFLPSVVTPETSVRLAKRAIDISGSVTAAKVWSTNGLTTMAKTARSLQLSTAGQSEGRNITEWQDVAADLMNYITTSDFQGLALNSPLAAVAAGLVIGILTPVCGILWLLFRRCNVCGGHRPSPEGYESASIYRMAGLFSTLALLNIIFAGVVIGFSLQFTAAINGIQTGIHETVGAALTTLDSTASGINSSPLIIKNTLNDILDEIAAGPFSAKIDESFGGIIDQIEEKFIEIDELKHNLTLKLNVTDAKIQDLFRLADTVPALLQSIGRNITTLKNITIMGVVYPIAGFPDTSSLLTISLPDLSSLPNVGDYIQTINDIPSLSGYATTIRDTLDSVTGTLQDFMNSTVKGSIPSLDETGPGLSSISDMINGTKSTIEELTAPIEDQVDEYFAMFAKYDTYRHQGMMGEMLLIIVPGLFAMLGVGIKKRGLMVPYCTCILFLAFFVWLQFVIFYLLSAPLNLACNSKDVVLKGSFSLPSLSFFGNETVSLSPQSIIDSCLDGTKIFDASINKDGKKVKTLVLDGIKSTIDGMFNPDDIKDTFALPDFTSIVGDIDVSSISSFDTSQLTLPNFKLSANVSAVAADIRASVAQFTPVSLESNIGNVTLRNSAISDFNAKVLEVNSNAVPYTAQYIIDTFVLGGAVFKSSNITNNTNPANSQNIQLEARFTVALARTTFIYHADMALTDVKARIETYINALLEIENTQVKVLTGTADLIRQVKTDIEFMIDNVVDIVTLIKDNIVPQFATALTSFIDWAFDFVFGIVYAGIDTLITNVFSENAISTFGDCKPLASSATYMIDSICVGLTDALSGFWFSLSLVGGFFIVVFIFLVLTRKRIAFLQNRTNAVKDKKNNDAESGDFGQSAGIIASAPFEGAPTKAIATANSDYNNDNGGLFEEAPPAGYDDQPQDQGG